MLYLIQEVPVTEKQTTKGINKMKTYTLEKVLHEIGVSPTEQQEMSDQEIREEIISNDFRQCNCCSNFVHADDFNGERDLCDICV